MVKNYSAEIEWRDINTVIPYSLNTKKHPEEQVTKIASSIAEFGFDQPVVIDADGVIIKGHGRREAALKLGLKLLPVIVRSDLSRGQVKAARIADNRVAKSDWDIDALAVELQQLEELGIDMSLTGFTDSEIDAFLGEPIEGEAQAWDGMPEYEHEDQQSVRKIIVHFATMNDVHAFAKLIGQPITENIKSIWYPQVKASKVVGNQEYAAGSGGDEP